jgi:hypothetical protein
MQTEFERTRMEIGGRGVTFTSWYEPDKQQWRANAPAFTHLMAAEEKVSTGQSRAAAIQAASAYLAKRLPAGISYR